VSIFMTGNQTIVDEGSTLDFYLASGRDISAESTGTGVTVRARAAVSGTYTARMSARLSPPYFF
jgi:hypothetical protein